MKVNKSGGIRRSACNPLIVAARPKQIHHSCHKEPQKQIWGELSLHGHQSLDNSCCSLDMTNNSPDGNFVAEVP